MILFGLEIVILAAAAYVGTQIYEYLSPADPEPQSKSLGPTDESQDPVGQHALLDGKFDEEKDTNQRLALSVAGAGFAILGSIFYPPAIAASVFIVLYNAIGLVQISLRKLTDEHKISIEVLTLISALSGLAAQAFILCALGCCVYFASAKLRIRVKSRIRAQTVSLLERQPDMVWLVVEGMEIATPLASLVVGDVIVVGAGEVVPIDGVTIKGTATVDQRFFTGEALPAEKAPGDTVLAGAFLLRGRIQLRVEAVGTRTAVAIAEQLINNTTSFERTLELRSEELSDGTVYPTIGIGTAALLVQGPLAGLTVLCSNFSSVFRLTSPWTMLNYMEVAAQRRILVKDGRSLDLVSRVNMIVFDKTGTLTLSELTVKSVYALADSSAAEVLQLAASAEQRQTHPIASAILREAASRELILSSINDVQYQIGAGVKVQVADVEVMIGSERFLRHHEVQIPDGLQAIQCASESQGHSLVYVAAQGQLIGLIELQAAIRPDAVQLIRKIRERSLSICLLSGDHEAPTRAIAMALGIERYFSEALPTDKARIVDELQAGGYSVCMVGDGLNDAMALKRATLSVSLGSASTIAMNSAQVILLDDTLLSLDELLELGKSHQKTQQATLWAAAVPSVVCMGAAFVFPIGIAAASACYLISSASSAAMANLPVPEQQAHRSGGPLAPPIS